MFLSKSSQNRAAIDSNLDLHPAYSEELSLKNFKNFKKESKANEK